MACETCRAIAGEIVLTQAPRLELDEFWHVEHVHPVARAGWLVLILKRHARALHELTDDEAAALGRWLPSLTQALHEATGSAHEYVLQLAEGEGFHHVHFHLVARMDDWPDDYRGSSVFNALKTEEPIGAAEASAVIERVAAALEQRP